MFQRSDSIRAVCDFPLKPSYCWGPGTLKLLHCRSGPISPCQAPACRGCLALPSPVEVGFLLLQRGTCLRPSKFPVFRGCQGPSSSQAAQLPCSLASPIRGWFLSTASGTFLRPFQLPFRLGGLVSSPSTSTASNSSPQQATQSNTFASS